MQDLDPDASESRLDGGFVNQVSRIGDTVRRSTGSWTPAVHALLRHLEAVGFPAPRVLGIDERGREVLTFLPGEAIGWTDWPPVLHGLAGLRQLGGLLRRYHDAVRSFQPAAEEVAHGWRNPLAPADGELIRHGDFSPFNTLWRDDQVVGVIDWDFAQPGKAITDLAYLAWYAVPLQNDGRVREYGLRLPVDRAGRLRALVEAYGAYPPAEVVDAAVEAIETERDQTAELADRGLAPWVAFAADGSIDAFTADAAWIGAHRHELLAPAAD
jgi:aminoglycoside phosphotransferase (APT) family kinase protein